MLLDGPGAYVNYKSEIGSCQIFNVFSKLFLYIEQFSTEYRRTKSKIITFSQSQTTQTVQ